MPRRQRPWARSLLRRSLVVGITVLALAVYGLVAAGGQTIATRTTAASAIGSASQLSVSLATSPTNNSVNVAARGPNNSLLFYWEIGGTWYGPLGLGGANTTYSAPSIVAEASGNFDIAVEGPGNTIYFYWDAAGTWYGPLQVGTAGATFSTPSMTIDSDGHLNLAAQGPSNGLYAYWNTGATWYGPLGIGGANSTISAPSVTYANTSVGTVEVYAIGPNNDVRNWDRSHTTGQWTGPHEWSNDQQGYSVPSGYEQDALVQGPNHSLVSTVGFAQLNQVGTAGTAYSAPSFVSGFTASDSRVTVQGPSHSLYYWFSNSNGEWNGPVQIGVPGSTYSAPAMDDESSGSNLDLAVQGPGNSLYFYWSVGGTWHGPVQIAGAGTTFSSSN